MKDEKITGMNNIKKIVQKVTNILMLLMVASIYLYFLFTLVKCEAYLLLTFITFYCVVLGLNAWSQK
jgi:hypothetical protein